MKPEQDPERTPAREATMKGRVTPVPPERSPDDRADGDHGEAEDVSRREALKGRVDPVSTEPAPSGTGAPDRNGDRARAGAGAAGTGKADGADSAVRPAGTGTTSSRATAGAGADGRGAAPADGRAGRPDDGPVAPVSRTSGGTDDGPGSRPVSRDAAGARPGGGPADTEDRAEKSAGRDERMLPLDEHDKFSLRMRHAVGGFIDGPQASVEEADHVLEELAGRFTEAVTRRRRDLRTSWQAGNEDKAGGEHTERLRLALRDYREMTERLLRI
ncbi:hypothetical protein ACFXAW_12840 [Streptomyces sp. NPDC059445]|uniref:hypothetical protein n=1 Tax=Streptomyces sp. NPDC059445 TaxID=3346832 RepID=UPI0036978769